MIDLISVIIPCYQQGCFLNDAITSLQAQTYTHWEAIIINDGSVDDTELIALALCSNDPRVKYVSKLNGGLSSARNLGLSLAQGQFIQFLDADDRLNSLKFETQVSILRDNTELDVVYGNARYFYEGSFGHFNRGPFASGPEHNWIAEAWNDQRPMLRKLADRNVFPVCTPLIRRSVVDLVGLFNEELMALEDWEYWIRCAISGVRFRFIDAEGSESFICTHSASMTQETLRMQLAGYMFRVLCHRQLPLGEARSSNLTHLLRINSVIGNEDRSLRYKQIKLACRSLGEYVLVTSSELFDTGGILSSVAFWIKKRLNLFL